MSKDSRIAAAVPVRQEGDRGEGTVAGVEAAWEARSAIDQLVFEGARHLLQAALQAEVDAFLERHRGVCDAQGRRQVVRNGYLPERKILTGAGALAIRQPRVRDQADGQREKILFSSAILPPYLRRSKAIDELIPWLYLKGVSTGDFSEALVALVGPQAKGLSANVVVKLKEQWQEEFGAWHQRDLSKKEYVYFWVDGIYFNIRLEEDRQCILVVIGATADGHKELVAVADGYREDEQSWYELLVDLKRRGLKQGPKLAVGDGALGFWAALRKVYGDCREQRCWVHKESNVLSKLPKGVQGRAKTELHAIWMAETRDQAQRAFDTFLEKYGFKYPQAAACLAKDREELLAFYDFPAEHWIHLRTTNPIESTFSTVRLRHRRTKGNGNRRACLSMVFKLLETAQKRWRRLNGHQQIVPLLQGKKFIDGLLQDAA
jgi:transposase-like protein